MFNQLDAFHSLDPFWIFRVIYEFFVGGADGATSIAARWHDGIISFWHNLPYYAVNFLAQYIVFSIFVSIALAILVTIYFRRYWDIRERVIRKILPVEGKEKTIGDEKIRVNPKWELVQRHIDSLNQADWKLAILEADIMLSELLEVLQLPGESIGERLKAVERSDFDTIEEAWEAHKIRNAIAHEGSDFLITEREARRVVGLYKKVFDEFEMI
ncbi:MAG: hypothetical protein WC631_02105 [Candidatus Paceibacterota bacterium]|jgi:hypothetical protein